jgi:Sugar (and other) transporter
MLCHSGGVTEQSRAATGEGAGVDDDPEAGSGSPPPSSPTVSQLLDEAPTSRFHRRAVFISGMGFFTDAYDLFVIATVATLVKTQWHLSTTQTSWVTGSAILAAFFGAVVFGRIADVLGRKTVYVTVAVIMIVGALASALAPGFLFLVIARFVLGLGIGGDYPVSAVLMSEYANRKDRGRLVGLVFSMQAPGAYRGPAGGAGVAVLGDERQPDLADPAGPGRSSCRRGGLPAGQDARVPPVPVPRPGPHQAGGRPVAGVRRGGH